MGETRAKKSKRATRHSESAIQPPHKRLKDPNLNGSTPTTQEAELQKSISNTVISAHSTNSSNDELEGEDDVLKPDQSSIVVQQTETKGFAVFTTRKVAAGTLLLAEVPLIRLTQLEEDADKDRKDHLPTTTDPAASALTTQYHSLSKSLQKTFLSLHDSKKSTFTRIKSIYYSNCYNLSGRNRPSSSSPGGSCMGLLACRFNHSCIPNVQFSYDETRNLMLFHAIKPIPKGREVLSTYESVYEVQAQRQQSMIMYYGFRCDCEACESGPSEFWARSDERRRAMIEARKSIRACERSWTTNGRLDPTDTDPIGTLKNLDALLVKEALLGLPRADVLRKLGMWCERLGNTQGMFATWERELQVCVACFGSRSVRVREIKARMDAEKQKQKTREGNRIGDMV